VGYPLRKAVSGLLLILGVTFISFLLMVWFGPEQTYTLVGKNATASQIAEVRRELGYDQPFLQRYADWRRQDQNRVVMITDTLARVFANPFTPLRLVRNLGLLGLDVTPGLKHLVAKQFMGLNGRLPRLARGVPIV